jgi:hypothetical protein
VAPTINMITSKQAARFTILSFLRSRSLLHTQELKQGSLNQPAKQAAY